VREWLCILTYKTRSPQNEEVQYRIACALNALAGDPENKNVLKDKGAVDALKLLVRSRDPDVKAEAIEALAKLGIHAKVPSYICGGNIRECTLSRSLTHS